MALELDAKQQEVVDQILSGRHEGGAIIAGEMATGKTNVAVKVCQELALPVVLLACPIKGTRVSWKRTFRAGGYKGEFYNLTNDEAENFARLKAGEPGVYIIGREYLHLCTKPVIRNGVELRPAHIDWLKVRTIDIAIFDEVHAAANRKSATYHAWFSVRPKTLKIGMSGTWFGNRFEGAWAVSRAIWRDRIDRSFWRWAEKWTRIEYQCPRCMAPQEDDEPGLCYACYERMTPKTIIRSVGPEKAAGEFVKTLPAYFRWTAELDGDDPAGWEPTQETLIVELGPRQRKAYTQMEDDALAWLEDNPLSADLPVSKYSRLRQLALGLLSVVGDKVWLKPDAESAKIDALVEWLNDHPEGNVLIGTDSRILADILPHRLKKESVTLWTGGTSHKDREKILSSWGMSDRREILVATIPAMAEGVDGIQHVCSTLVWMSKEKSEILNQQFRARLLRRGQKSRVHEVEIVAAETKDEPGNNRLDRIHAERLASQGGSNV